MYKLFPFSNLKKKQVPRKKDISSGPGFEMSSGHTWHVQNYSFQCTIVPLSQHLGCCLLYATYYDAVLTQAERGLVANVYAKRSADKFLITFFHRKCTWQPHKTIFIRQAIVLLSEIIFCSNTPQNNFFISTCNFSMKGDIHLFELLWYHCNTDKPDWLIKSYGTWPHPQQNMNTWARPGLKQGQHSACLFCLVAFL